MEQSTDSNKRTQPLFEILGPRRSFIFGMIAMFMTACTIGFFVLLANGGSLGTSGSKTTFSGTSNTNTTANTNTTNTNAAAAISLAPVTSDDHIRGDLASADVVLVEYSDLECPYCKQFHSTLQQISDEYGDQVAWVYRHFPLESLHPKAPNEAQASECAFDQGGDDAFWKFIDQVYSETPSNNGLDPARLPQIAGDLGLNVDTFNDCLSSGKFADKVQQDYQDAVSAGGTGTPYSVAIGKDGTKVPINGAQPYASVKSAIDSLL